LLALGTPAIFGIYAAYPAFSPLNYIALVPWALLALTPGERARPLLWIFACWSMQLALYPQFFGFAWYFPLVRGVLYLLPWFVFPWLMRGVRRALPRVPLTFTLPLVWTSVEFLRLTFSLAKFDLYGLGYSQAPLGILIQISDVFGFYGVSFLVAMVSGLIVDVILAGHGRVSRWKTPTVRIGVVATIVMFGLAFLYGAIRLRTLDIEPGPRLAVVQPNLEHSFADAVGVHLEQLWQSEQGIEPNSADLIVWPENAILDNLERPGAYLDDLAWLNRRKNTHLLIGSMGKSQVRKGYTTNTAFLVGREGEILGTYDKQLLFPWSEYVPFERGLQKISPAIGRLHRRLIRMGWGFLPSGEKGTETKLIDLPYEGKDLPFGTLICVENTYPPIPAEAARAGARFLVNTTSEGEVGGSVQVQLLRISALRAVETRLAYVRAGNTGISTFIGPTGRTHSILIGEQGRMIFDRGILLDRVRLSNAGVTLYVSSRDLFAKTCLALSLLFVVVGLIRRRPMLPGGGVTALLCLSLASLSACGSGTPQPLSPEEAGKALTQARQASSEGRWGAALDAARRSCGDPVVCEDAMPVLRDVFVRSLQPEAGVVFLDQLIEGTPAQADAYYSTRAFMNERSLELEAAAEDYERAIIARPRPFAYRQYANLLMRMDRPDDALPVFRDGIERFPNDTSLRYFLARTLRLRGEYEEALTHLEKLLIESPENGDSWTSLARVYAAMEQPEAAATAFQRALEADPRNVEARFRLVKKALRDEDIQEAGRLIREIRMLEADLRQ
jgi:apolipoprotein N-acyltransferase